MMMMMRLMQPRRRQRIPFIISPNAGRLWMSGGEATSNSNSLSSTTIDDEEENENKKSTSSSSSMSSVNRREPMRPYPSSFSGLRPVPSSISCPPYARSGLIAPVFLERPYIIHDEQSIQRMRFAAQLARKMLDLACHAAHRAVPASDDDDAKPTTTTTITTDDIDELVHNALVYENNAYPSPLNYSGFPKSICSSINEVVCHGIPDSRPLQYGDIVSFDVSCYVNGVHGDNCATIILGDDGNGNDASMKSARRLVKAAEECLYAAIDQCKPGGCLSNIGSAISDIAESYGYDSVQKYRGHGISENFHCAPYVKHYRNNDKLKLRPGMIFTIEPMITEGNQDCYEWNDQWTVVTKDGGCAAQFEHTVLITENGVEILTLPPPT